MAEFRGGKERLAQLEERFAGMVEAPLAAAFSSQQGEGWCGGQLRTPGIFM